MRDALMALEQESLALVAATGSLEEIEQLRVRVLGRKGQLTQLLRGVSTVEEALRPQVGALANQVKERFGQALADRLRALKEEELARRLQREKVDITLPGRSRAVGSLHPVSRTIDRIAEIFSPMGFVCAGGPEVESDWHNFGALNIPPDHPAREMHDTFYLPNAPDGSRRLLRTHTSPVQVRVMESRSPPLRVIAPGKVYRCDSDLTHTPMFHQVEGFLVDEGIHFGHLKGVLEAFLVAFFGRSLPVRFRPSFFPFTEPSAEVDMGCLFCEGRGCRVCKGGGWLEVLGCGMIHPEVMQSVRIDRERYTGFAFGMGVERLAMLQMGIDDLRNFFDNDWRFLERYGAL